MPGPEPPSRSARGASGASDAGTVEEGLDARLDALSIAELRARRGGEKWTRFPDCIGAFVAEMDFGTAPVVSAALHEAVDRTAFGYLPEVLAEELAESCATLYRNRWGWAPPAEWIRPVADVIKAAEIAIEMYSPPASKVVLPTPNYMPFVALPGVLGREAVQVPMVWESIGEEGAPAGHAGPEAATARGRWEFDLDALDAAFATAGARATLILCNPANPLGRVFTVTELMQVAEIVERHGGRVFADEIHAPLTYAGHHHVPYASLSETTAAHTLTAFSASKAWNIPGLKCAQLLFSNEADVAHWEREQGFAGYGASTLGAIANTAAFNEGGRWLGEVMDYLEGNRRRLAELLAELAPRVGYTGPEGTYLAWLDFRDTRIADQPAQRLRDHGGVALTEGTACGEAGRGFARFNFAMPRPILEQAVGRIAATVNS